MKFRSTLILGLLGVAAVLPACADTLTIAASTDTWIFAEAPDSNENGDFHGLAAGVNAQGSAMRAMFTFDLSQIPANATITSASVSIESIKQNFSAQSATFELHRLIQPWVATEATWNNRSASGPWSSPGAAEDSDYASAVSASQLVTGAGVTYTFGSTAQMVADVQSWVANASANNGWFFKVSNETTFTTSRRWGSTTLGDPASLTIVYSAPALPPQQPTITNAVALNNQFQFTFNAEANRTYTVETRTAFDASSWTTLTNFPTAATATNYLVADAISQSTKFYRVKTP
jgi:hypothetical protein